MESGPLKKKFQIFKIDALKTFDTMNEFRTIPSI